MPVLYGVLMYMGVASLKGMQFVDRIGLLFMPPKYQPDYSYLRHVPIKKVHLFTFIQASIQRPLRSSNNSKKLFFLTGIGIGNLMDFEKYRRILDFSSDGFGIGFVPQSHGLLSQSIQSAGFTLVGQLDAIQRRQKR